MQKASSILRSNADRAVAYFAAHFEPQVAFARKLPNVVESVIKQSKAPHWGATTDNKYIIRETNKKFFYLFDHQVFFCQTLGLGPWIAYTENHFEAMSTTFNKMDVTRIKRLGFMVSIHLPLEMSHAEMCDLMFGSYLVDREKLSPIYGKLDDLWLQFHGYYRGIRSQTTIAPQTVDQSRKTFLGTPHLEAFVEPKFLDTCIKEHYERVSTESLNLVIEMSKEDVPISSVRSFLSDSLEGAESIAAGTVRKIKGLKTEEETDGDPRESGE